MSNRMTVEDFDIWLLLRHPDVKVPGAQVDLATGARRGGQEWLNTGDQGDRRNRGTIARFRAGNDKCVAFFQLGQGQLWRTIEDLLKISASSAEPAAASGATGTT